MVQSLARLIEEVTVDAYDTDEQMSGFLQVFQDEVAAAVAATVLGVAVEVTGFDLGGGDERRGLVACLRHRRLMTFFPSPTFTSDRTRSPDGFTPPPGPGSASHRCPPNVPWVGHGPNREQTSPSFPPRT